MIQLRNASLSLGKQLIFNDISVSIGGTQRMGVVGRNGAGKSTLLKVIAGLIPLDQGNVTIERDKKIAYMSQDVVILSDRLVFEEALTAFGDLVELESERKKLEFLLHENTPEHNRAILERYSLIQEQLKYYDIPASLARTEKILKGLGFTHTMQEQPVMHLSVGWKMRLVLAKLLLQDADFYLFDEPTNHLDIMTKEWFFDFLANARCGYLLVSHDRYYLDRACEDILELERGKGTVFTGNFTAYIDQKEQRYRMAQASYERQQKEIARKQATIDRFRALASKAKMAQSMIKQLDKVELIEIEPPLPILKLTFPPAQQSGARVVSFKNIKHSFDGTTLFDHIEGEIQRGEKVALIAPNGTGKTTLFNLIIGKYGLQRGTVTFGHNVHYAIFEQDQIQALTLSNTIYGEVLQACPDVTEAVVRNFLGSFLFSGDTIDKKIEVLSGGERTRVAMVKVLLQKANFLLLDEPTNHLDLYSKEVLLQALQQYNGTLLIVSHDHDFLNKLTTRMLELTSTKLFSYPGNYESYTEYKKNQSTTIEHLPQARVSTGMPLAQSLSAKELFTIKKEASTVESKIARLEQDITNINALFLKYQYGTPEYQKAAKTLQDTEKSLREHMSQWELLQVEIDRATNKH
jgi:ATP-binding cassette, subfamily F, member 3